LIGNGDVDLVIPMLAGQTNFEAALDLTLPTCGAMV